MHVSLEMKRRIEVELFAKLGSGEKNLGTFVCFFLKEVICWGMRRSKGSVGNKEIREMCSVFSMTRASEDFYALMLWRQICWRTMDSRSSIVDAKRLGDLTSL